MDEDQVAHEPTVGEQLKAARVKQKMSLEDIAAQTRIPLRHLESIEESAWDRLPAPTYTIGFAKAYAGAVGVDRTEVGDRLRDEFGGSRYTVTTTAETFEPADPARSMPKWLVLGGILAVLLVVGVLSWLNQRSLQDSDEPVANAAAPAAPNAPPPLTAPTPQGPVVISPKEPVWLQVYEKGGASYYSGILNPGANFTVPADAKAPLLKTGKPEGLTITVGSAVAPPVGPAGKMASDVSLLGADLLKGGAAPATATSPSAPAAAPSPASPRRQPAARARPSAPAPASAPSVPPPTAPEPAANATGG